MFNKKDSSQEELTQMIEKWGSTLHNDLYRIHQDNLDRSKSKKEKEMTSQLKGLRNSLCLDSCSGLLYIYENKIYKDLLDIDIDIDEDNLEQELPITRVIDVEYLVNFIDNIIEKR